MKKLATILLTLLIYLSAICQEPVIKMTTNKAIGSKFSFSLVANDNTHIQVDFGDGNLVDKTLGASITSFSGSLGSSKTVKIYGTGIIYLYCSSSHLTELDVTKSIALKGIYCDYNQLNTIDLTQNTALIYLECYSNQLTTLDVTKNTKLTKLSCHSNSISSLDLTKNTELNELICYSNQLSKIDVTKNIALKVFWCHSNLLTVLDVTKNIALSSLSCSSNQLSTLDVTKNIALSSLSCSSNQLSTLDVTKNKLFELHCSNNQLTFKSLPPKHFNPDWDTYSPQQPILIDKSTNTGVELDLSTQNLINGNTTVYTWKTKGGIALVKGTDYNITDGKTIFFKTQTDSVYCEMTNATFPEFTGSNVLKTTLTKVTSTTAVTTLDASEVEIYSNQNTLYINTPYNAQVSIFETNGRLVLSKDLTSGSNSIQLENIGIYLVKVLGNKGVSTKKVFIK